MSRKRAKDKRAAEAVPEEILAEGSGPNEVIDANPQTLVAAAQDLVDKRKTKAPRGGKRAKGAVVEAPTEGEQSDAVRLAESDVALAAIEAEATHADEEGAAEPELDADDAAFDAAADSVASETVAELAGEGIATAEGEAVAAVEDAMMRAEAEAELGDADELEAVEEEETGAALPTTAASMDAAQLKNLVEALVFAADKPVTLQRLRQLTRVSDVKRLEQALTEIGADYQNRGIALQSVSGGYQFRTNTQYSVWVQQLIAGRPVRLSRAQLETLAIVAYRQPITRPEIDEIRGVDSSATLRLLLDRSMIRTLGKKEEVGRPMLYGTTKEFLDFFSLSDLRELPTLREYSELTAESRKVMTDRLGVEPGEDGAEASEGDIAGSAVVGSDGDAVAAVAAVDSSAHLAADSTFEAAEPPSVAASAPGHVVRDGVEYDRWGQPLGPVGGEDSEDSAAAASDEDIETAGGERIGAAMSDEGIDAAASDEGIDAAASDEDIAAAASDEDTATAASDEDIEAAGGERVDTAMSDEGIEPAMRDEAIESAMRDEAIESAMSDEGIEPALSDEGIEGAGDERIEATSDEGIEAAGDERIEAGSDERIEAGSDERIEAASDERIEAAMTDEVAGDGAVEDGDEQALGAVAGSTMEERANLDVAADDDLIDEDHPSTAGVALAPETESTDDGSSPTSDEPATD